MAPPPACYAPWVVQGPAEVRPPGAAPPRVRLVCIGPAGAGACFFHGWGAALPDWVEVLPVELPGRNTRIREPKQRDLRALAAVLAAGLAPLLLGEARGGGASTSAPPPAAAAVPFALLGHSFGAWLAYELALALRRAGAPAPLALFVSANRAPALAAGRHDPDPLGPSLSPLPPPDFWRRFQARYGDNPDLRSPAVRAFVHPLLAADFACIETYDGPPADEPPLACALYATGAEGDARYRREQIAAWAVHAALGAFAMRWETPPPHAWATPHRFMLDAPAPFQAFVAAELARLLSSAC